MLVSHSFLAVPVRRRFSTPFSSTEAFLPDQRRFSPPPGAGGLLIARHIYDGVRPAVLADLNALKQVAPPPPAPFSPWSIWQLETTLHQCGPNHLATGLSALPLQLIRPLERNAQSMQQL